MPKEDFPLIAHADLDRPLAWREGSALSARSFLAEAHALAARLPRRRHVLNLCNDRYRFMVAFGAALINGQTCVLPPNHAARVLEQVRAHCEDHVCVGDGAEPADAGSLRYPDDLEVDQHQIAVPRIAADHVAAIVFTSGSTGEPQPNIKAWGRLVLGARAEAQALSLEEGCAFLGTVPPQHMFGFESTVLLPMQTGGFVHAWRPLFAEDVKSALEELPGEPVLITTPIHIRAMLESGVEMPSLRRIVSASAPLNLEWAKGAEERFRTTLMEIFGFTEAGMVATRRPTESSLWNVMPHLRLVRQGEHWAVTGGHVNGTMVFPDVIEPRSPTSFVLHGRTQDIVNVGGKRASLGDLNQKLNEIPGVLDGVFMLSSKSSPHVQRLTAFVVAPDLDESEILGALRQRIDPAFMPRPLLKVAALPRTPSGKLPLEELRALEASLT